MIDAFALMYAGINPPPQGKNKTQCPKCSATRKKSREKCMVIKPDEWGMAVYCHHCGYKDMIVT